MNRLFFTFFSFGIALTTLAKPIDVETGRKTAENFFNTISKTKKTIKASNNKMMLVYESPINTRNKHKSSEFYVFSPTDSIGFVIVAGDDEVTPIVGYSSSSKFLSHDIPTALTKYLSSYSQYIQQIWKGTGKPKTQYEEDVIPISPLIRTTWNQTHPYNKYCPKINGKSTYTGCVATAVAQIMKYHEWPKKGHGTCFATLNDGDSTKVVTNLEKDYQWNIMRNSYYSYSYTTAEANAVAQLMKDVGYACNVHYGVNSTYAYTYNAVTALLRHFDYSPQIQFVDRNYYSNDAWNNMIYKNLSEGQPVLYRGNDKNGEEGHFFICSGVDQDGRYHINWGWGSLCDGYFDFNALTPNGFDYNYDQQAIINIKPIEEDESEKDYKLIPHVGRIEITEQNNSIVTPKVTYTIYVTNTTDKVISGQTGYAIFKNGKMISDEINELITYNNLKPNWYWWYSEQWIRWNNAVEMSQGIREIRFFWRPNDKYEWYEPFGEHTIYMLTTEDGHYFTTNKEEFDDSNDISLLRASELQITPINGGISLTSIKPTQVKIYTVSGMMIKQIKLTPSQTEICKLPQGLYLINGIKILVH